MVSALDSGASGSGFEPQILAGSWKIVKKQIKYFMNSWYSEMKNGIVIQENIENHNEDKRTQARK